MPLERFCRRLRLGLALLHVRHACSAAPHPPGDGSDIAVRLPHRGACQGLLGWRVRLCRTDLDVRVKVYFNGMLDQSLTFANVVLANEGPMYVGGDPWLPGIQVSSPRGEYPRCPHLSPLVTCCCQNLAKL